MHNIIIALWGCTASGKTSLADYLVRHDGFTKIKTCTTRPRRTPAEDDYHFVTTAQFKQMNTFAGTYFAGNYYGSSLGDVKQLLAAGHHKLVIILTWDGIVSYVNEFKDSDVRVCPIEVYASQKTISARLRSRYDSHMTRVVVRRRIASYQEQQKRAILSHVTYHRVKSLPGDKFKELHREAEDIHNMLY